MTGYLNVTNGEGWPVSQHLEFNVLTATCPSRTSLACIANKWTAVVVTRAAPHWRPAAAAVLAVEPAHQARNRALVGLSVATGSTSYRTP